MKFMTSSIRYLKRKLFKYSQERLDHQFQHNKWDFLEHLDELPRYSVLVGCHRFHNHGGSILDVGCGQGILLNRFEAKDYSNYLAIDFSEAAVKQIPVNEKVTALQQDMTTFVPKQKFDSIIFNESLYYVSSPIKVLERYLDFLTPKGFIYTSIHLKKNGKLVDQIKERFEIYDQSTVVNKWGESWTCLTIKKLVAKAIFLFISLAEFFLDGELILEPLLLAI